ncbi:hypothetical protein PsorP6_005494 [Peronosclerospora sorghi]|uniref:Uncharacterized protein n=1 Tax=Peronosclerospora sorghi TaxID=230839 RepID=A0ACC0W0P9_9STRA|nr:hypothetical protein PsorP6_005494 [Peronosclerospora sorghi]
MGLDGSKGATIRMYGKEAAQNIKEPAQQFFVLPLTLREELSSVPCGLIEHRPAGTNPVRE